MRWWARRQLRAKIFLPFSLLMLATLLVTLWLTNLAVSRQVEATLKSQLVVTGEVFRQLVAERAERLLGNTTLLAGDFALKRAIATYDPATLASVAINYQDRIKVDLFWITDETGKLLAAAGGEQRPGQAVAKFPPVADALSSGNAAAISEVGERLYQVVAVPVLAPDVIGFVVAGKAIDDRTAEQLQRDTGSHVSFVTPGHVFASSWSAAERDRLFPGGAVTEDVLRRGAGETFLAPLGGERWLSILVAVDARLSVPLYAFVQRSYDEALAPLLALRRRFAAIGAGAVVGALLVGAALASGIAAPLHSLVGAMRQVLAGNFRQRLEVKRQDEIGFLSRSFNDMVAGLEEREMIKDTFGRFVSREIADAVLSGRIPLAGERREVTILFQDIRGFTSISERSDPADLVDMLNRFLTQMVAAVEAEGGVIRQFTGDGVMALFGAPVAHADDPDRAVRAALGMLRRLEGLNVQLRSTGAAPLRIGVGVHTGEVVVGKIGPDERIEYSVVGDAVNLASRIEGLTKEMNATLLISDTTAARLDAAFTLGRRAVVPIRGKEKPVGIVEVLGYESTAERDA